MGKFMSANSTKTFVQNWTYYLQDAIDRKFPEEENISNKKEISLKTVPKKEKNYQFAHHGKSFGCNHTCGKQGITNYSCGICDKSFIHKSNVQTHITTIHQAIKIYSCDICDKSVNMY